MSRKYQISKSMELIGDIYELMCDCEMLYPQSFGSYQIIYGEIRERREGCGLSQSQLGKAIGSTQSYISTIENGSGRIVNCVKLYSIAQALDVSMDDLMGRQRSCPQKYTLLNEDNQEIIIKMIQVLLDKQQEPQGKSI